MFFGIFFSLNFFFSGLSLLSTDINGFSARFFPDDSHKSGQRSEPVQLTSRIPRDRKDELKLEKPRAEIHLRVQDSSNPISNPNDTDLVGDPRFIGDPQFFAPLDHFGIPIHTNSDSEDDIDNGDPFSNKDYSMGWSKHDTNEDELCLESFRDSRYYKR